MTIVKMQVISGIKWSMFAKIISQIFSWIVTFVVIRILMPEDYGIIELATAMVSLGLVLGMSGFSDVIVQRKDKDPQLYAQVFTLALSLNFLLFLILFLSADSIADWYNAPNLGLVIKFLSVNLLFVSLKVVPAGILKREMDFKKLSLIQLTVGLLSSALTLTLALLGYSYWSIAIGSLAATIMSAILLNFITRAPMRLTTSFKSFGPSFHFGVFTVINQLLTFLFLKVDSLIIGKVLGISSLGFYSAGSQLANLPLEKVAQTLNEVSFAGYAKVKEDKAGVSYYFLQSSRLVSLMVFPVFWGMASIADPLVDLFLGEKWLSAAPIFQILALVMPFRIYQLVIQSAIAGIGFPKYNSKNLLILCVVIPISVLSGLPWGIQGAAIGWALGYLLFFLWMIFRSLSFLNVMSLDFIKTLATPMMAGLIMLLINFQLDYFIGSYDAWLKLIILIGSGAVTYISLVFFVEKQRLILLKNIIFK
ncbi:MAG: lipopolysaccharide biosynthesis protein [Alteromonadaceae bacterium]|nr:lipopolysaccharide biosynthesis protein [Alteromonadaceae bacterium]